MLLWSSQNRISNSQESAECLCVVLVRSIRNFPVSCEFWGCSYSWKHCASHSRYAPWTTSVPAARPILGPSQQDPVYGSSLTVGSSGFYRALPQKVVKWQSIWDISTAIFGSSFSGLKCCTVLSKPNSEASIKILYLHAGSQQAKCGKEWR